MAPNQPDFTTRRGYIAGMAGTTLSLAGVWKLLGLGSGDGHGHGHGGSQPLSPAQFTYRNREYVERYERKDGVLEPPRPSDVPPEMQVESQYGETRRTSPVYLRARRFQYLPPVRAG